MVWNLWTIRYLKLRDMNILCRVTLLFFTSGCFYLYGCCIYYHLVIEGICQLCAIWWLKDYFTQGYLGLRSLWTRPMHAFLFVHYAVRVLSECILLMENKEYLLCTVVTILNHVHLLTRPHAHWDPGRLPLLPVQLLTCEAQPPLQWRSSGSSIHCRQMRPAGRPEQCGLLMASLWTQTLPGAPMHHSVLERKYRKICLWLQGQTGSIKFCIFQMLLGIICSYSAWHSSVINLISLFH